MQLSWRFCRHVINTKQTRQSVCSPILFKLVSLLGCRLARSSGGIQRWGNVPAAQGDPPARYDWYDSHTFTRVEQYQVGYIAYHISMFFHIYMRVCVIYIYVCVCVPNYIPDLSFTVLLASSERHGILGGPSQAALAFLLRQGDVEIMSLGRLGNPRTKWTSICGSYTWQLKENLYKHRGKPVFSIYRSLCHANHGHQHPFHLPFPSSVSHGFHCFHFPIHVQRFVLIPCHFLIMGCSSHQEECHGLLQLTENHRAARIYKYTQWQGRTMGKARDLRWSKPPYDGHLMGIDWEHHGHHGM